MFNTQYLCQHAREGEKVNEKALMGPECGKIFLGQVQRVVEEVIRRVSDNNIDPPASLAWRCYSHNQRPALLLAASSFLHIHLCSIQRSLRFNWRAVLMGQGRGG